MAGALQPRNGSLQKPLEYFPNPVYVRPIYASQCTAADSCTCLKHCGKCVPTDRTCLVRRAIDAASGGKGQVDFQTVYYYALQMIVFYVASAALAYLVPQIVLRISQRTVRLMRGDLFYKLMRLPVKYFDTHQIGELLSRISYDIDTVNTSLSNDLVQILTSIITIVGALVMMIKISPLLVLVL